VTDLLSGEGNRNHKTQTFTAGRICNSVSLRSQHCRGLRGYAELQ